MRVVHHRGGRAVVGGCTLDAISVAAPHSSSNRGRVVDAHPAGMGASRRLPVVDSNVSHPRSNPAETTRAYVGSVSHTRQVIPAESVKVRSGIASFGWRMTRRRRAGLEG